MESGQTPLYVFSNVILYLFMLVLAYKGVKSRDGDKFRYMLSVFLMFLFCEYAFWGGDYYHYIDEFKEARLGARVNLEPFYYWVAQTFESYGEIRLVIWGGGLILLLLLFRIIDKKPENYVYTYISTYFIWFSYARASLAMCVILLGLALIAHENKKMLFLQIAGIALLIASLSLHKSATYGVAMAAMAFVTYRFGKWVYLLLIMGMVAVLYLYGDSVDIASIAQEHEERMQSTVNVARMYLEEEERFLGMGELVEKVLFHLSIYMVAILYIMSVFENKAKTFSKYTRIFGCYAFWTALTSSVFLLDFDYNTLEMYERFSMYALIPASFLLSKIYESGYKRRFTTTTIIVAVLCSSYTLIYVYYCTLVK